MFRLLSVLLLAGACVPALAADLPIFDAHIHYSHDAWESVPPKEAIAILRKAGVKRALVSSSNDEGTQNLYAEALLKPLRLSSGEADDLVAFLRSLTDPQAERAAVALSEESSRCAASISR